jgi:hypothetical protein
MAGGLVVSGSLGYRFSSKWSLEFGPSIWIEGRDVMNNGAANNERPSNKRTLISFNGLYKPFIRIPVQVKLGAGIGSIIYTPNKSVVIADGKGTSNTEFASGIAGCIGLIGEVRLSPKIKIHPSLNFTISDINQQKIDYSSNINHHKPSITTDFRLNFMFAF